MQRKRKRKPVELLWYFKIYIEQLRGVHPALDRERLIRFFLADALDAKIKTDFKEWLKHNNY